MTRLELINAAIPERGMFIHRYSGIEFSVSELIMRSRGHPDYRALGDLPRPWAKKPRRFKQLVEMPGPIAALADGTGKLIAAFEQHEGRRHFLVHGIMVPARKEDVERGLLTFSMYDHKPTNVEGERVSIPHMGRLEIRLSQLEDLNRELQAISSTLPGIVARICREVPLPKLRP